MRHFVDLGVGKPVIPDDELPHLDEFAFLDENAAQAGTTGPLPQVRRVARGPVSALRWGAEEPHVVFLHGGGQNAHTWDTVILGLGEPALAIDLPGHGRSQWREDGDYGPKLNANTIESMIAELAPNAELLVGMSLGGLTAMRLAVQRPHMVRRLVMVDVTPSAPQRHSELTDAQKGAVALVQGPRSFPSFQSMVDMAVLVSPNRSRESLRRGVFHNSKQLDDGTWTWRYDEFRKADGFDGLWDDVPNLATPTTLVRGADSAFVNHEDADEFARTAPGFNAVHVVPNSGHSVQGDQPLALIQILRDVLQS
jgi:pimeloyl-ACP methyl ester carboxylesterase